MSSELLTPTIYNVTLTDANTEYPQALPAGCKYFSFQNRSAQATRYAFETGKVASPTAPYGTVKSGSAYNSPEKLCASLTLYLASGNAGDVIEITAWSPPAIG